MADTNPSANMSLPVPVVGVDPGPQYATDINSCLTILDGHDHSSGSGVQVTPSGININADLPFGANNATGLRSVRMNVQSSPLALPVDLGCLYVSGVDLYFNDENGNQIKITASGAVAGTPGSISGLASPASASFNSGTGTFIFRSGATTPGNIDGASHIIREQVASPNGITLASPTSLGANYTLTLMGSLPASQKFLSVDSSGNIASTWAVDNSTIEVLANVIQVKDAGITLAKMATQSVGQAQLVNRTLTTTTVLAGGIGITGSSGSISTSSGSPQTIPNHSVTITTLGRPVSLSLQADGSGNPSFVGANGSSGCSNQVLLFRGGVQIAVWVIQQSGGSEIHVPSSSIYYIDPVAAGTYAYEFKYEVGLNGIPAAQIQYTKMVVYET